jgi:hypothetical protein
MSPRVADCTPLNQPLKGRHWWCPLAEGPVAETRFWQRDGMRVRRDIVMSLLAGAVGFVPNYLVTRKTDCIAPSEGHTPVAGSHPSAEGLRGGRTDSL